jgi:hypothetical protein
LGRNRSSPFFPPAVPDLRGLRERRYFDKSGLNQHRGIPDLMRYAAMAEGIEFFSSFDGFIPFGGDKFDKLPNPDSLERFSEAQLYALALWLYCWNRRRTPHHRRIRWCAAVKRYSKESVAGAATLLRFTRTTS